VCGNIPIKFIMISAMQPLDDVFVVDLSRILSGPICTMMLADMGAEVIKVEPPPHGDDSRKWGPPFVGGISTYFHSINRNKKSLGLNLRSETGKKILWELIERADVLIENFKPGILSRLGFGYEAVSSRRPGLVYCSISGFGQTGPYRSRPGYDVVAQGESGLMDLTGYADGPPAKVGTSISDIITGMYAAQGILLALLARARTGKGQWVDVSLLDSTVSTLTYQASSYLMTGRVPSRMGTRHPSIVPYECFRVRDGFMNIGVTNQKQWVNFCGVLQLNDLIADPRFASTDARLTNYAELKPILDRVLEEWSRTEILNKLFEAEVPAGPINTVAEILADPQIDAREMVRELTHPEYGPIRVLGLPIKMSETPGVVEGAPPCLGEHNREVLSMLGYSEEQIRKFGMDGTLVT
jgi:crotonobetainyl-CoA:carnitine CoA-transferase CaiB-like acyl-CoA transferase